MKIWVVSFGPWPDLIAPEKAFRTKEQAESYIEETRGTDINSHYFTLCEIDFE